MHCASRSEIPWTGITPACLSQSTKYETCDFTNKCFSNVLQCTVTFAATSLPHIQTSVIWELQASTFTQISPLTHSWSATVQSKVDTRGTFRGYQVALNGWIMCKFRATTWKHNWNLGEKVKVWFSHPPQNQGQSLTLPSTSPTSTNQCILEFLVTRRKSPEMKLDVVQLCETLMIMLSH